MHPVIEKLLSDTEDPRSGIQVNIIASGVSIAGAVRHSKIEGFYELLTMLAVAGQTPRPILYYIDPKAIDVIAVPVEDGVTELSKPSNGGILIPGRS